LDEGRDKRSCSLSSNILPDFHRHNDAQAIYPAATCPATALNLDVYGLHTDCQCLGPKPEAVQSGPAKQVIILRTFVPICSVTRVKNWAQSYPHQHMIDTWRVFGCEHDEQDAGPINDPCFCSIASAELVCVTGCTRDRNANEVLRVSAKGRGNSLSSILIKLRYEH
jgi:hypothetical protein